MAVKISVSFAYSAVSDLEDIQRYYENEQAAETGRQIIAELIAVIERLGVYPKSGRIVPEFDIEHLREIIHPPFRIVYRYEKKKVRIVRVWRSERELKLP